MPRVSSGSTMSAMSGDTRILAIETSGKVGSVALGDQQQLHFEKQLTDRMRHASQLIPLVREACNHAGWPPETLTDVYVSIGPGSFTGLRIGVALARTLAWSAGVRTVAVSTAAVLARNALDASPAVDHVAIVLDARSDRIFGACFDLRSGEPVVVRDACLVEPAAFLESCPRPLALLGEGIPAHRPSLEQVGLTILDESLWPGRAAHVWTEGRRLAREDNYTPGGELMPHYIRIPDPVEKWEKRRSNSSG